MYFNLSFDELRHYYIIIIYYHYYLEWGTSCILANVNRPISIY